MERPLKQPKISEYMSGVVRTFGKKHNEQERVNRLRENLVQPNMEYFIGGPQHPNARKNVPENEQPLLDMSNDTFLVMLKMLTFSDIEALCDVSPALKNKCIQAMKKGQLYTTVCINFYVIIYGDYGGDAPDDPVSIYIRVYWSSLDEFKNKLNAIETYFQQQMDMFQIMDRTQWDDGREFKEDDLIDFTINDLANASNIEIRYERDYNLRDLVRDKHRQDVEDAYNGGNLQPDEHGNLPFNLSDDDLNDRLQEIRDNDTEGDYIPEEAYIELDDEIEGFNWLHEDDISEEYLLDRIRLLADAERQKKQEAAIEIHNILTNQGFPKDVIRIIRESADLGDDEFEGAQQLGLGKLKGLFF